jgi:glycosyltransferase involved in cell wall biosynthesis
LNLNNRKILFLIFSPLFTKGGHSKNFLNLIIHLEPEIKKHQFTAYIISYNNNKLEKVENVNKISKISFFNTYKVKILRRVFPSGKMIFQLGEYFVNFIKTAVFLLMQRPDIVYSYSNKPLYLISPLKKIFNFKLIYDMRGDILDESKAQGASNNYIYRLSKTHKRAIDSVDLIFSVSTKYNNKYKYIFINKFNYYDGEIFKYNESSMIKKKNELGLYDKFVFVYTGNTHYYQYLDGTMNFFSQFLNKHPDSFLIIITEYDYTVFDTLFKKYKIPDSSSLFKSLPQNQISELQQIADMGFLMREDLPLNHHSYPTKFAEYLASGVPVLMTPHIHSIAPVVIENNLGEVIENKDDYSEEIEKIYNKYKNNFKCKEHCSQFAKKELMWQKKSIDIFDNIRNL